MKIKLGETYTDRITGFSGIAMAKTEYYNGCNRVALQAPLDKDGKIPEYEWVDETQLQATKPAKDNGGGPRPDAPKG